MINPEHKLSLTRQAELLDLSRASLYYERVPVSEADLALGIEALYRRSNAGRRHPRHLIYPYLLRKLVIDRPNQVWATDVTYIPMAKGFVYLVAVMEEAIAKYGAPEIFNTDQGSQFTASSFIQVLQKNHIQIRWTGVEPGATTCSSSGYISRSSTKRFTCMPTTRSPRPRPGSDAT